LRGPGADIDGTEPDGIAPAVSAMVPTITH